jgi:hypothetical protein
MTRQHVAHPVVVVLRVDGVYVRLSASQVSALRSFGSDGVLDDDQPDFRAVHALARHGWVLRSRGHFVLTPKGRVAQAALADYFARKADALKDGAH